MESLNRIAWFTAAARRRLVAGIVVWAFVSALLAPSAQAADETIDQLIRQLHQPIAGGRVEAAKQLARFGQRGAPATAALIKCLQESENDLRLAAAYALGCVGQNSSELLTALVPVLADADEHVRYSAEWSVARIANSLDIQQDAAVRAEILSLLRAAIKQLSTQEHQPRHRAALEAAVAKLVKQAADDAPPPAPPPPATPETADTDVAASVYAASDILARYQLAEQLCDVKKYPDSMRRFIIEFESRCADPQVLRYAAGRWGDHGQALLAKFLEQMTSRETLDLADANIIELIEPASQLPCAQLIDIATNRAQPIEVRSAALSALSKSKTLQPQSLDRWVALIANGDDDSAMRWFAADTLGDLGGPAVRAEAPLIALLGKTQELWIRGAVAVALSKIAPTSSAAAHAVHETMRSTPPDDPSYADLVYATGHFGALASESAQLLIAALDHSDESVRQRSAQAIAQLGAAEALRASDPLARRIVDPEEVVSVKNSAALALKEFSEKGLAKLVSHLQQHGDPAVLEAALRGLAVAGTSSGFASSDCAALLDNHRLDVSVRAAAAIALGAMGKRAAEALPSLLKSCTPEQPEQLRAASLIALARIEPAAAQKSLEQFDSHDSILLRASAAFTMHLCGDSRAGFDNMLGLIDGSDTDWVIEQSFISDFGPVIHPWLVEVATDARATNQQRFVCFRVAFKVDPKCRAKLLPLVADVDLGEQFAVSIEADWFDDIETMTEVLDRLRNDSWHPMARARIAYLLTPDGLGAGGDDEDWQGLTLTQPLAIGALGAAGQPAMQSAPPSGGAAPNADARAESLPESSQPGEGMAIRPVMPLRARAPEATSPAIQPQLVNVYYGTNRARLDTDNRQNELAISILATAGGSLLAMVFCLVGFLRSGHRVFAAVALLAIGIVAPFGYLAANKYTRESLHAPVAYGVDYRSQVELGVCEVSLPPGHQPGMLEGPSIFTLQVQEDINKHIVLTDVAHLSNDQFYESLHGTLARKGKNVLVFIHGYNVSFDDAARRTAQMAVDLKFPGAPVFYSWPSQANWYGYATDKANIQQSVGQIKDFLLELAARSGADTINLVAHSMGNVGLTQALKEMEGASPKPMFNQVVLAAPDVDAEVFKSSIAPHIVTKAQHVTLYTSQSDLALIASRYFNRANRLGDSGSGALIYPGIDTIDATDVDSSLLGHSYYGSNVSVLSDLGRVLENQPIARREYLRAMIDAAQPYWAFDPVRIAQLSEPENDSR